MNYEARCREATLAQGLDAFAEAEGWSVEQTGGFTMVAVKRNPDRTVWTVTWDGPEDAPYFAVLQPLECWEEEWDEDAVLAARNLPLADALALGSEHV